MKLGFFFHHFLKFNISVIWRAREASFGSFCSIFYPRSNGVLIKSIRVEIKKLQSFKNWKNAIFAKSAILAIFYFTPGGFQCVAKGIFILNDLKLGEISTKKAL